MMKRRGSRQAQRTAFAAAAFLTAAGIGGAPPACAATPADGVVQASQMIERHHARPAFTAPGAAFDAKACAAGKKMLSIPNNSGNPFLKGIIEREILAGRELGLAVQEWQNQGQPSQWTQGVDYAVRNHFNIIDLISGIDPKTLEPQLRAAAAAGVKTMASHFYDPSQTANPLVAASLPVNFNAVGKLLADWVIMRTSGRANVVLVESDEVPPTQPLVRGFQDELKEFCSGCRIVQQINVGVTEWATKIQPSVQSALLANPGVNFVVPIYDSMTQFVVPAVQLTGKRGSVRIATFNGTPFVLDYVRAGSVDMDIGESLDWIARATVDGYLRAECGLPVPRDLGVPLYVFDAGNAKDAGIPAGYDQGYGSDYLQGFRTTWKLR